MVIQCHEYLRHTAAAQIAYKITCSRSLQVEYEEGGGFQKNKNLKKSCKNLKCMLASHIL